MNETEAAGGDGFLSFSICLSQSPQIHTGGDAPCLPVPDRESPSKTALYGTSYSFLSGSMGIAFFVPFDHST
jgi:hypothetical protein